MSADGRKSRDEGGMDKSDEGHVEMIKNPVVLALFKVTVDFPKTVICLMIAMLIVACHFGGQPYHNAKTAAVRSNQLEKALAAELRSDVVVSLKTGFAHDMTASPALTNVVMWTDSGAKLQDVAGIAALQQEVLDSVKRSVQGKACAASSPKVGALQVSSDGSEAVFPVMRGAFGESPECERVIQNGLAELNGRVEGVFASVGSPSMASAASLQRASEMMFHHLKIIVPVLLIILFVMVGRIARGILAFVIIGLSVASANALAYFVHLAWDGFNFAAPDQIGYFVLMALGVDYALFFWTRFAQERKKHPEPEAYHEAIMTTLKTSGCVIFISVLALLVVYAGLSCYPHMNANGELKINVQLLFGIALLGVSALAGPASMAAQFPSLFDEPEGNELSLCGVKCPGAGRAYQAMSPLTFYFKNCSAWVTRYPYKYALVGVIFAGFVPFLVVLSTRRENFNFQSAVLSPSLVEARAVSIVSEKFSNTRNTDLIPVLMDATLVGPSPAAPANSHDATSMLQVLLGVGGIQPSTRSAFDSVAMRPEFGRMACKFFKALVSKTRGTDHELRSGDLQSMLWNRTSGECIETLSPLAAAVLSPNALSRDGNAQVMYLAPRYKLMGHEAQSLVRALWDDMEPSAEGTFDADGLRYRFRARHFSAISTIMRMEQDFKTHAPIILPVTAAVVCLLFGYLFRSLGIAVKVLFTVILPLAASYGITVGAFQYGWFESLGIMHVEEGLYWTLFYTGMNFLFALAVDYDMFLFARVYEYRQMGYDNQSAVLMGLKETGPVITAAGIIMMVSFFALCCSDQWMLQQLGFLYFAGVAVDTCLVQLFVAPAMLCISEQFNYWPGQLSPVTKSYKSLKD